MGTNQDTIIRWTEAAAAQLVGRKIASIRYLSTEEMEQLGWCRRAAVLVLDNGHQLFPSADDEGNDAGALFTTFEELPTIPVI